MSHTIFNIVVDALVRATFWEVYRPQEALHGLGRVAGEQDTMFYADDYHTTERNQIWGQGTMKKLVLMFENVGLYTKLGKTKSMISIGS